MTEYIDPQALEIGKFVKYKNLKGYIRLIAFDGTIIIEVTNCDNPYEFPIPPDGFVTVIPEE